MKLNLSQPIDVRKKVQALQPSFLGKLMYYVLPLRRSVVLSNMQIVFGKELNSNEIKRLAQSFYSHLLRVFFENMALTWVSDDQIRSRSKVIGAQIVIDANEIGKKGSILLAGHFGNWEMTPIAAILHYRQFYNRFYILRKTLVNKFIERILFRRFYRVGLNIIPKRNTLNRVLDAIQQNDVVAFIMDQYAKPGRDGIEVNFCGRPAGTFRSLALIGLSCEAPIIPAACYYDEAGTIVMHFYEPLPKLHDPDPDKEVALNTRLYNQVLERFIRERPEQWLWMHKRWKKKKSSRR